MYAGHKAILSFNLMPRVPSIDTVFWSFYEVCQPKNAQCAVVPIYNCTFVRKCAVV